MLCYAWKVTEYMSQDMPISLFRNVLELNFAVCDMWNTPGCESCAVVICLWCTHQPHQWSVCMYDMCIFIMWYVVYGDIRIAHRYIMCASLWLQITWAGAHFTCLIMGIANGYKMPHIEFLVLFTHILVYLWKFHDDSHQHVQKLAL